MGTVRGVAGVGPWSVSRVSCFAARLDWRLMLRRLGGGNAGRRGKRRRRIEGRRRILRRSTGERGLAVSQGEARSPKNAGMLPEIVSILFPPQLGVL
jgi:hypothetical protein